MNDDQSLGPTVGGDPPQEPRQDTPPQPAGQPWAARPVTPQPQPPKKSRVWIPFAIGGGCLLILFVVFCFIGMAALMAGKGEIGGGNVALIEINGVISTGSDTGGLFGSGGAGSETIIRQLEKARKDDGVKVVVLRIDSPGGSPAASEEIYNEIKRVKDSGKKVYASMGDVAASGGYYVAAPCTQIYADKATLTGSIGVIFESTNLQGLFKKIGVDVTVVKSGKFKDIGSSNRPMTPEEKQMIQTLINDTFDQFIAAVSDGRSTEGRKMSKEKVKSLATGAIFTGRQAQKVGLIDEIGGLHETVIAAARAAGIKGEPEVVNYSRRRGPFGIFDEASAIERITTGERSLVADEIIRRLTEQRSPSEGIR